MNFRATACAVFFLLFAAAWPVAVGAAEGQVTEGQVTEGKVTEGQVTEGPQELMERVSRSVLAQAKADADIQRGNRQKILALVRREILPYQLRRKTASLQDEDIRRGCRRRPCFSHETLITSTS